MTFKRNQPVTVQTGRATFEDGKFMSVMSNGRIKVLFPAADPKKNPEGEWDIYPASKVKPALPKKTKRAVVEDAITKVERKAGRDPSEHVGAWDTAEVRKAVAAFGKRAKMSGKPYHEIRNAYEAKHGPIPKLTASERAQIVRENKAAESALMNAAENKATSKRKVNNVSFTPKPTGGRYLATIDLATFHKVCTLLRTHLVFIHNGKLRGLKTADMIGVPTETELELCREAAIKKFTTNKDPKPVLIFLNGMTDAALIETVATKVRG